MSPTNPILIAVTKVDPILPRDSTTNILRKDADDRIKEINDAHSAKLKEVEEEMELQVMELTESVDNFRAAIKDLSLEDLTALAKDGTVQVGKSSAKSKNGSEWLTVPGGELKLE